MVSHRLTLEQRFWKKVDKRGEDECWNWTAGCTGDGYGIISVSPGVMIGAHRYSYELHNGPIPNGMKVCTACKNPLCVNPKHLYPRDYKADIEERFWRQIDREGKGEDECWLWTGTQNKRGYGVFREYRRNISSHRYSYELHKGAIPKGLMVRHSCHNPPCCNPRHLSTGKAKDNAEDAVKAGRWSHGEIVGTAKLTDAQVITIKKLLNNGIKGSIIAKQFSVSRRTISFIKEGKSWKHIILENEEE